jgi:hypothetical protein
MTNELPKLLLLCFNLMFISVIDYTFPYIILVSSVLSTATVLAKNHITVRKRPSLNSIPLHTGTFEQCVLIKAIYRLTIFQGFRQLLGSKRLIAIMVGHWLLLAYGLLALTQVSQPVVHGPMFVLVTTPVIFYLATSSLTEPSKFKR